jgi:hypothetical protein
VLDPAFAGKGMKRASAIVKGHVLTNAEEGF